MVCGVEAQGAQAPPPTHLSQGAQQAAGAPPGRRVLVPPAATATSRAPPATLTRVSDQPHEPAVRQVAAAQVVRGPAHRGRRPARLPRHRVALSKVQGGPGQEGGRLGDGEGVLDVVAGVVPAGVCACWSKRGDVRGISRTISITNS